MSPSIWRRCRCLSALFFVALFLGAEPAVELRNGTLRLTEWTGGSQPPPAGWESVFAVYAGSSTTPMLGTYTVEDGALTFHPRFPLDPDTNYHGIFPNGGFAFDAGFRPPALVRVDRVYPSADLLPANTLRLYIYFTAPVKTGDILRHIRLLDDAGNSLPDTFLDQELWDPDHRRLTVLFDPGRIKRGLVPAKQAGSPIVQGRRYTLVVDAGERFEKRFTGGPAIRTPADPAEWTLQTPSAGTTEPLVIRFPRAMDYALLQRTLSVPGLSGKISVAKNETEWRFIPDAPWKAGAYRLEVESDFEDICGNHADRAFDVDLRAGSIARRSGKPLTLSFRVGN